MVMVISLAKNFSSLYILGGECIGIYKNSMIRKEMVDAKIGLAKASCDV